MDINNFLKEFIIAILDSLVIILIYLRIFKKSFYLKEEKLKILIFIIIYSIFTRWAFLTIPTIVHKLVIIVFTSIVLAILASTKLTKSFLATLIAFIYCMIIEFSVNFINLAITHKSFFAFFELSGGNYKLLYVSKFIEILILLFLYKYKKQFLKIQSDNDVEGITTYWVLGMFLMGLFLYSITIVMSNKINIILYQILLFLLFVFFIIIGIIDYKKKIELINIKTKYDLKQEYIKNLEDIIDIIRREKHDFANHINTIYAMCILNRPDSIDKIKQYLKNTTINLETSYQFYNTGNNYIDGLIAVKTNFAFEHNIYLDVDFETLLDVVDVNDNDLVAIVGNILDNAFYAVSEKSKEGKKIVSLYGYLEKDKYYLSIANNGPMIPKEIGDKIFKKDFSTKNDNKKDHGYGLFIVDQLIRKNGGEIIFSSSPEETEFLIKFKLKEDLEVSSNYEV